MSSERLRQIEDLYHSARERGAAVLTGADPDLRQEVEKLLAQDSESGDKLLDQSAAELLAGMRVSQVEAGSILGPYKIEAPIGEGGMGQVFRARDTRLDRTVAIKVLKEWSGRFEKESRAIAALNHPNICTLHDVGPNYLVMELIEGETLAGAAQAWQLNDRAGHSIRNPDRRGAGRGPRQGSHSPRPEACERDADQIRREGA